MRFEVKSLTAAEAEALEHLANGERVALGTQFEMMARHATDENGAPIPHDTALAQIRALDFDDAKKLMEPFAQAVQDFLFQKTKNAR